MSYDAEISRLNPTCFIFLVDQSGSMSDVMDPSNITAMQTPMVVDGRTYTHTAQGATKAEKSATAINRLLQNLVIRCSKDEGVRDYYYISVIGYNTNRVGSAFGGVLSDRYLVPISELAANTLRLEIRTKKEDDNAGGLVERSIRFPIWFEPVANGGTPMCQALTLAKEQVSTWLTEHPNCYPPCIMNITDGESTDGDPTECMNGIKLMSSTDGNALLFNCHISASKDAKSIEFPATPDGLPDQYARGMFEGASVLTSKMLETARNEIRQNLPDDARGFVMNATGELLINFLDIGTRRVISGELR